LRRNIPTGRGRSAFAGGGEAVAADPVGDGAAGGGEAVSGAAANPGVDLADHELGLDPVVGGD